LAAPAARARGIGHDHVLRLDVAVDDAALVGMGERIREREPDPQHVAVRELAGRLELCERPALHQLGDQVAAAVLLAGVEQRDDRVVIQARDGACLALRPFRRGSVAGDDLHRDGAAQELVAPGVHGAEATGPDACAQPVAAHGQPGLSDRRQLLCGLHSGRRSTRAREHLYGAWKGSRPATGSHPAAAPHILHVR
jgi:hypothetical protein